MLRRRVAAALGSSSSSICSSISSSGAPRCHGLHTTCTALAAAALPLPAPLRCTLDDPAGPFAHDTITNRLPNAILQRTAELNADDLDAQSRRNLTALIQTLNGKLRTYMYTRNRNHNSIFRTSLTARAY